MSQFLAIKLAWQSLSWGSKFLVVYGFVMLASLILTYAWSLNDHRLIRERSSMIIRGRFYRHMRR